VYRLFLKLSLTVALVLACNAGNELKAQISHGGTPLFYAPSSLLKSAGNNDIFIEMPPVNADSLLKDDELNESNMRGSFRFAYKFYVDIEKGKSGKNYILSDGTKVWQVGIRSRGAYSINVLFSEYKVPPGGKLFLYNSDRTQVIGSFTDENNSPDNILPVQPVAGDEIIVEYQEPANSEFEAQLKISEVNHDYKGFLRREPGKEGIPGSPGAKPYACMPDVLCADPEDENIRSVVLVMINGTDACTGTLLNTTNNDGEPVLLTAVHCLNESFNNPGVDYTEVSGTIVCFFNYNKPVCNQTDPSIKIMKGTQEMSLAGATPLSIVVNNDMALLKLKDTPPDYYQPYYAGWNVDPNAGANAPFVNIHHPNAFVSKYGNTNINLTLTTFPPNPSLPFNPGSHWQVPSWDVGATAGGSSGSPLFDNHGLLVGGLTGGSSNCPPASSSSDYFFALYKSWEYTPDIGTTTLKNSLDPQSSGVTQWDGYDPYKDNPLFRLKTGDYNNEDPEKRDELVNSEMIDPEDSGLVFGNNSLKMKEFAEEFSTDTSVEVVGVYLLAPPTSIKKPSPITIKAYKNSLSEENLVASEVFYPTFTEYDTNSTDSASFIETPKSMLGAATESFVKFQEEAVVGTKFYVSYAIADSSSKFSIYNMVFDSPEINPDWSRERNSAWLCDADGKWLPATEHPVMPMSAGLAIEPLVRYKKDIDTVLTTAPAHKNAWIIYLRATQQLKVNTDNPEEKGMIFIYSIAGQLLYKAPYQGNNPVNISSIGNNNIVVVKAVSENGVKTGKIVL